MGRRRQRAPRAPAGASSLAVSRAKAIAAAVANGAPWLSALGSDPQEIEVGIILIARELERLEAIVTRDMPALHVRLDRLASDNRDLRELVLAMLARATNLERGV